ncbi:MAG: hypothetical protein JNL74_17550, partial [Fibrobacteres bacterium]|nr:hypothetical protein [Fibrobacterota bacterium]
MNSEDKTRILRGLVEHEGRWIPIGDKLKTAEEALLPKEKHAEQVATEMVDAPAVTQPSSPDLDDEPLTAHETAAVARFADALKGEETDSWS